MTTSAAELWQLLGQAEEMPYGAAQIALVEQLLRHVDEAGDPQLAFCGRLFATTAYVYGGEPGKAFVPFSWCVADFDRNPQPYHQRWQHNLLWLFKAMISALTKFPEVPLERTYAVLDDMERRYRESGHGMQAVHKHRYIVAAHIGRWDEADAWYERWQATPRDSLSDCAGCDPSSVAAYLSSRGRFADAVEHADPVLSGNLTCSEQPQTILAELMVPYLMVGRADDAAAAHRRSYRLERGNLADLADIGAHVAFCARTGNEHRGLEILQRHLDWLERPPSPFAAMEFAAAGSLLLRRLTALGHGDATITRAGTRAGRDEITAAELADELAARATELAAHFDARNGTDHQSRRVADKLAAEPYEAGVTLSPTARPAPVQTAPAPEVPAEPAVEPVPAGLGAAELLALAKEHHEQDRDAALAATLAALDERFPGLDDPLPAGRRAALIGHRLRIAGEEGFVDRWAEAADLFTTAGATGEATAIRGRIALERAVGGDVDEEAFQADLAEQEANGGPAERSVAWSRLSTMRFLQKRYDEAEEAGRRSDELAAETGDPRRVAVHAVMRSRNLAALDRGEEASEAAREAWEFFREHGPARRLSVAAVTYGYLLPDPVERVEVFGVAIAAGVTDEAIPARFGRGHALKEMGRAAEAIPDLVEAVALTAEQTGADSAQGAAFARFELAEAYAQAGRPVEAAEVGEGALLIFEELGLDQPADNTRFLLAAQYRELGDNVGAIARFRELIERLADNPAGRGQIAEEAADLLYKIDRDAEAAETFRAAAEAMHEAGDLVDELRVLRRRIAALHFADEPEAAAETWRLAGERFAALPPELAAEPNAIWQNGMTAWEWARVLMTRGRQEEVVPLLRDVPGRLHTIGAVDDAGHVTAMYGEALLRSGSPAQAADLLRDLLARMAPDAPGRGLAEKVYEEARAATA